MIRLAVVEDGPLHVEQLETYLDQYQKESKNELEVTIFCDRNDILEHYKGEHDIILMDLQTRFMEGIAAAEKLRRLDPEVMMMLIASMSRCAKRETEADFTEYIPRPVSYAAFSHRIGRAIEKIRQRSSRFISVPLRDGLQKLAIARIYYVERQGHSLIYHTGCGEVRSRGRMKEIEEALAPHGFFRSNKGYLVNMKHVDGVREGCCLVQGKELLISRSRKNMFLGALAGRTCMSSRFPQKEGPGEWGRQEMRETGTEEK